MHATDDVNAEALSLLTDGFDDGEDATVSLSCGGTVVTPVRAPTIEAPWCRTWVDGDEVVLETSAGARLAAGPAAAVVDPGPLPPDAALGEVIEVALAVLLGHRNRFVLHAAGVGDARSGRAIVATGDTGAGKSTLAFAALEAHRPVLGDDLVAVCADRVTGIPLALAVPSDLIGPKDQRAVIEHDLRRRTRVPATALATQWWSVAATLVLGHSEVAGGDVSPITATEAYRAILRAFPATAVPSLLRAIHPVAASLARRPASWFGHGSDPLSRVEVAQRNLDLLFSSFDGAV